MRHTEAFESLTLGFCRNQRLPEVASIKNITLPGPAGPIQARVYNPQPDAAIRLPGLVYFHGGTLFCMHFCCNVVD